MCKNMLAFCQGKGPFAASMPVSIGIEGDWHFYEGERVNHAKYGGHTRNEGELEGLELLHIKVRFHVDQA